MRRGGLPAVSLGRQTGKHLLLPQTDGAWKRGKRLGETRRDELPNKGGKEADLGWQIPFLHTELEGGRAPRGGGSEVSF